MNTKQIDKPREFVTLKLENLKLKSFFTIGDKKEVYIKYTDNINSSYDNVFGFQRLEALHIAVDTIVTAIDVCPLEWWKR